MDRPHHPGHDDEDDLDPRTGPDGCGAVVIPVAFDTCRDRRGVRTVGDAGAQNIQNAPDDSSEPELVDDGYDVIFANRVVELTPRQRRFVEVAAWTLADDVYDAADDLLLHRESLSRGTSILSEFPPYTWMQPERWWREQARCFDDLAAEAQHGVDPKPRSTGEEMALHLILQRARMMATDSDGEWTDLIDGLDVHARDEDWEGPLHFLFRDHDLSSVFDGESEPCSGAVDLETGTWFTPFGDTEARQATRGHRR